MAPCSQAALRSSVSIWSNLAVEFGGLDQIHWQARQATLGDLK